MASLSALCILSQHKHALQFQRCCLVLDTIGCGVSVSFTWTLVALVAAVNSWSLLIKLESRNHCPSLCSILPQSKTIYLVIAHRLTFKDNSEPRLSLYSLSSLPAYATAKQTSFCLPQSRRPCIRPHSPLSTCGIVVCT